MNAENLKRGNEIAARLKVLQEQVPKFEQAEKLWDETFAVRQKDRTNTQVYGLRSEFVDFSVLRVFALEKINAEIKALETEFNNL